MMISAGKMSSCKLIQKAGHDHDHEPVPSIRRGDLPFL